MPKLRIYVETSVWSFAFADDAPDSKMLERTRKWRREAFETDAHRSQGERDENARSLAAQFGLQPSEPMSQALEPGQSERDMHQGE